jgi:hypothetical protein
MPTTLTFGGFNRCELAIEHGDFLAASGAAAAVADPAAETRRALAVPNGYPSLALATVPGDRVAIAVEEGVPQAAAVVRGAILAMLDAGVPAGMITVVVAGELEDADELTRSLASIGASEVRLEKHEADDAGALAMVGVTAAGEPLRINRTLAEADFVLPIGVSPMPGKGDAERFAGLYPQFGSREAIVRARTAAAGEIPKARKRRVQESNEAGWLLGVGMRVSVVRGPAGQLSAILAGDPETVAVDAAARTRAIWERPVARQGGLVVASVVGRPAEQTWENLARAVVAASSLVEPGGPIALYSELELPPSGPLNRLMEAVDFGEVQRELTQDEPAEAFAAITLARALESGPVYLRSRLPGDVVESLGMTPIADEGELARLAAGRAHCIIIEEAQRVVPRLLEPNARDS